MSWEEVLKREIYEGDPNFYMDKLNNESAKETYDWFMTTMDGKKHPKGTVHDRNLLFIFANHTMRAFEGDKSSKEYQIASALREKIEEVGELHAELHDIISANIEAEDR